MGKIKKLRTALFDIESNGLLAEAKKGDPMDRIHCLVIREHENKKTFRYRNNIDTTQLHHTPVNDRFAQRVTLMDDNKPVDVIERDEGVYAVEPTYTVDGDWYRTNRIAFHPFEGYVGKPKKAKAALITATGPGYTNDIDKFNFKPEGIRNDLEKGVDALTRADFVVGHNIVSFDLNAIELIYPGFLDSLQGKVRDTLVMVRMIFADQKLRDFKLKKQGILPGFLVGKHSLDSWGYRLGLHKGDYKADCKKIGIDPWAYWNMPQEDYCENDVDVTEVVWNHILKAKWAEQATVLEHQIHELMGRVEHNGMKLNVAKASKLADDMIVESEKLKQEVRDHFDGWFVPKRKVHVRASWVNDVTRKKKYAQPKEAYGEDDSNPWWADIVIPKRDLKYKDPMKANRIAGAALCPIVYKEFNPGSRQNIIDRYTQLYGWIPTDFTETGQPSVNDDVLKKLDGVYPLAHELSEIFFLTKRASMIKTGDKSWLNHVDEDGLLHPYYNVGGTISGRAAHQNPNIGQVVKVKKDDDGKILMGRAGRYGYEMRDCFIAPDGWTLMGVDLSGIEARCLANLTQDYDGGHLRDLILLPSSDIHTYNMEASEYITSREDAKTELYALMYGSGDENLGHIVQKQATQNEKRIIGKSIRSDLMEGLPGLKQGDRFIQKMAKRGFLDGLDGRRLFIRKAFAALNLRLQSDGAVIAKKWAVLFEEYMEDAGYVHGWKGDYVINAWVHDELQTSIKEKIKEHGLELCIKAALDAGTFFGFGIPVDAQGDFGSTWAETH